VLLDLPSENWPITILLDAQVMTRRPPWPCVSSMGERLGLADVVVRSVLDAPTGFQPPPARRYSLIALPAPNSGTWEKLIPSW